MIIAYVCMSIAVFVTNCKTGKMVPCSHTWFIPVVELQLQTYFRCLRNTNIFLNIHLIMFIYIERKEIFPVFANSVMFGISTFGKYVENVELFSFFQNFDSNLVICHYQYFKNVMYELHELMGHISYEVIKVAYFC